MSPSAGGPSREKPGGGLSRLSTTTNLEFTPTRRVKVTARCLSLNVASKGGPSTVYAHRAFSYEGQDGTPHASDGANGSSFVSLASSQFQFRAAEESLLLRMFSHTPNAARSLFAYEASSDPVKQHHRS
jgi:hypothetical protein